MIRSIDHIVLTTGNLEACLHFYEDILGMEHRVDQNGQHSLHFGSQKINLHTRPYEFSPAATNVAIGSQDFCLISEWDINEIKDKLEEAGVNVFEGPVKRNGALGEMDSVYMYDPDGNLVEIAVY